MRLLIDLLPGKTGNLYASLNYTLNIIVNTGCGLLSEISKLRKFEPIRLSPQTSAKFLLIPAVIVSGILSICATTLIGEEVKTNDSSVEQVAAYRSPFSLPSGVQFAKRAGVIGAYSEDAEWREGVVANNVNGIFKSGNIVRANIDGIWVREGDWVGEEQVMKISTENVVLAGGEGEEEVGEEEMVQRKLPLREGGTKFEVIERVK